MTNKFILAIAAVLMLSACEKVNVTDAQLEKAVGKYIKENPEAVIAALRTANGAKGPGTGAAPQPAAQVDPNAIGKVMQSVTSSRDHAIIGNASSKRIVVEFYDYNCGYCKRALDTVQKLATDDKAKVILVELPVLGPDSQAAAKASVIVNRLAPNKFMDFHKAVLTAQGHLNEQQIKDEAYKVVDKGRFDGEWNKEEYAKILAENMTLARSLGIGGTPSFIVNKEVIRGAMPYETFKAALNK